MAENKEEMEGSVDDDPSSDYEKQRLSFITDVKRFNTNRGTPFDRVPEIGGFEIDLYHLYQRVTSLGGWHKVNYGELWEDFLEDFGLPFGCVNATQALKNIYFRYLNVYEKVNFLGEDPDIKDHDEEEGPTRKKVCLPIETIPLNYNYNQHKITDAQRQQCNLATELYVQKEYEKLEMSLRSGLPNEVDMAINVCVLLSTEGRHCMKLERTYQLLRLLMAHVAVFEENTFDLQQLYHSCWMPGADRNFLRFWFETVNHPRAKPLITFGGQQYSQKEMVGSSVLNLGRDLGTLDSEGQRVLQLAVFLHNLSFEETNQQLLARNYLVFKFLMLSLHSTYDGLRQIALDTIANLSCEIVVDGFAEISSKLIMDTLNDALFSDDRFFLVRGMEMMGKLSQMTCNEEILLEQLQGDTYRRLVDLLTVQDIQLIVHTLEALYRLSKIGEPFTTRIARVHKAISVLVSLVTIEAQSFGPGSLVGIKVVEYIPPTHVGPDGEMDPAKKPTTVIQPINPDSINIYQVPSSNAAAGASSTAEKGAEVKPAEPPKPPPPPLTDIHTTTCSWLNATYELKKKSKTNQVELFSDYLQFCRKFGITNAMSSAEFLQLAKDIFHQCEVISINRKNGDNDVFLEGLSKRSTQKPFAVTTLPPEKGATTSSSSSPSTTTSSAPSSMSSSAPASSKPVSGPQASKGGRVMAGMPAKGNTPQSKGKVGGRTQERPASPLASNPGPQVEEGNVNSSATPANHRLAPASHAHPSLQQALQPMELAGEPQSVKSLLAKKLSHVGSPDMVQTTPAPGLQPNGVTGDPGIHQTFRTSLSSRISNAPIDGLPHQNISSVVSSAASTSQAILIQQHHPVTMSSIPSAISPAPAGRFVLAQQSPPNAICTTVAGVAISPHQNSTPNQNTVYRAVDAQQKPATPVSAPPQHNMNSNSTVLVHQNPGSQKALHTNAQVLGNNLQPFSSIQQNGPAINPQLGSLSTPQCQQAVPIQIRPSTSNTVPPGSSYVVSQSSAQQSQPQNGPNQLNNSFPATVIKNVMVGQQHQNNVVASSSGSVNMLPGTISVSTGGMLRAPSSNIVMASQQQVSQSSMAVQQGTSLTQAISSPAVAALLTSNPQQGSSPMIISAQNQQAQIVTRPPSQSQQQMQQAPSTVVIQTPPGTIVMPSRQMQGGTVSFIVPPQYQQGSPVTFIQQNPSGAPTAGGINMLPSLALANSSGGVPQALPQPAQQRQIVLATPGGGQTTIPVGMQISSIQGNAAIIRNHSVCINSMQQQQPLPQPQQHNYVIQAASSSQLLPTPASASSPQLSHTQQVVVPQQPQHQTPLPSILGVAPVESQLARSEVGVPSSLQPSLPSVVTQQQAQCNGVSHDQNGLQGSPDSMVNDMPPSPLPVKPEKEVLNGKCSNVDKDSEHIKSFKVGGKMNGVVHTFSGHDSREVSPLPAQNNANNPHGGVLVNGCMPSSAQVSQNVNIPVQGLQMRSVPGGGMNGNSSLQTTAAAASVGLPHQIGNGLQNQQQQRTQQQQLLQHSQISQIHQPQITLQQPQQQTQLQQQQQQPQLQPQQQSLHQAIGFQQHAQQQPQPQRVVTVRPVMHQTPNVAQQPQGQFRPRISTLTSPLQQQQQQQLQQALQSGPRPPAGLPKSGTVPTCEAGGTNNGPLAADTLQVTTGQTIVGQPSQKSVPLSISAAASKKRSLPAKPTTPVVVTEPARGLRKKKPGSNEVVVTPGAVQTRKQAQGGPKPVQIAMQYMCEWASCRKCFSTARLVLIHVFKQHVPTQDSSCQWAACEKLVRKRWSLISHIQDHHCSEMAMRAACQRRYTALQQKAQGATPTPPPPAPTPMIYPPDAAMQAIRRFSVKQPYSEFAEQREGPVSKHIRLTSALILRNICHASSYGRRLVRQHEEVLSYNTMSNVESSTALSHCLWEIAQCCDKDPSSFVS